MGKRGIWRTECKSVLWAFYLRLPGIWIMCMHWTGFDSLHYDLQEYNQLQLPTPGNISEGYDSTIYCKEHSGYTYYLQVQFILLCIIVLFQVGPSTAGVHWDSLHCNKS